MARLFFAVWPDGQAAERLARLAAQVASAAGGKPVPPGKIHLTLAFLGEVPAARIDAAREAVRGLTFARFAFVVDRVGSFPGARVAWAGSREAPAALAALQSGISGRLAGARFALEERAFAPHATLARRIRRAVAPAAIDPIPWDVDDFRLMRSESGTGRYEVVEMFAAA